MNVLEFDVLIIGSGVAGLSAAVKLAERKVKVGIVTREKDPNISNTYWAQGGIIAPTIGDETLIEDIQKASSHTSNVKAAVILADKSRQILDELLIDKARTDFERDAAGNLLYTKEAAHSTSRILYKGDFTGKEVQVSLLNYLKDRERFPNVTILTGHTAIDLLTPIHHGNNLQSRYEDNQVVGAYVFNQDRGKVEKILAKKTVLATGGIGSLYLHHTNSESARGDGHAMAKRAELF